MGNRPRHEGDWVVLKFGGTSVSSVESWKTISAIIREREGEGFKSIIVCSAVSGISDCIEKLLDEAVEGAYESTLEEIASRYLDLARSLGVDSEVIKQYLSELSELARGVSLVGEASPRIRAQALASGELMSTKLGYEFLKREGLSAEWQDARNCLTSDTIEGATERRSFLSATCSFDRDPNLRSALDGLRTLAVITQGFIARDRDGETVLLGRGGSDVSAAYFAAKIGAARCEVWTDVPGMYTANPRIVPSARLLTDLDYKEAQEIATLGAKVLHPRCIQPLARHNIPLHVRCSDRPEIPGTVITPTASEVNPQVKAISMKRGITLISMETVEMWQQVGFLARIFDCFRRYGLSIDLVSTSETNVSVTLDPMANPLDSRGMNSLMEGLGAFCQPSVVDSCAIISLVGRNIRSILHHLTPALKVFDEQKVYMVSQAANDLNLSFVVDDDQVERLVRKIHGEIFFQDRRDKHLGPSWDETFNDKAKGKNVHERWWYRRRDELLALGLKESPLYVYDRETIGKKIEELKGVGNVDRIFYSLKANPHPVILKSVHDAGFGFECVSLGELEHAVGLFPDIDRKGIVFTPNFVPAEEYKRGFELGVHVTLDNLYPLERWSEVFKGRDIFVRMDPGQGRGHHDYVKTAGSKSKFGVSPSELELLKRLTKESGVRVVGLHAHVGSNIFKPDTWGDTAKFLCKIADLFPDVRVLDVGGGLGVAERPGIDPLDLKSVNESLMCVRKDHPEFEIWIEPGRFIVAEAGVLLARVTQTKQKGDYFYVGINAGMNALIRPALYGSYHEMVNLTRIEDGEHTEATIVGPICESGDVLGYSRYIARPVDGDIILIGTVGAYGKVMGSNYNMRGMAGESFC